MTTLRNDTARWNGPESQNESSSEVSAYHEGAFAVVITKPSGEAVVFTVRPTRREAEEVAARLKAWRMPWAEVVPALSGESAGSTRVGGSRRPDNQDTAS